MKKMILFLFIVILLTPNAFADSKSGKDELPAYLLSFFIGYGTGHYYLGDENATAFLVADILSQATMLGGIVYVYSSMLLPALSGQDLTDYGEEMTTHAMIGYGVAILGSLASSIIHLWEFIDIFSAVDEARDKGIVASAPAIAPIIQPTSGTYGLQISY